MGQTHGTTKKGGTKNISRRSFIGGLASGAACILGLSGLKDYLEKDPHKPQLLYEYSVDNYWYTKVDNGMMTINPPMKGSHQADIVIIGGGFTGLSTAWHLIQKFPEKRIVILEGACCGYGGSGRNGGHHGPSVAGLLDFAQSAGPELGKRAFDVTAYGDNLIKEFAVTHNIDCEYHEKGQLVTAITEDHMKTLEHHQAQLKNLIGIDSRLLQGREFRTALNSPRFIGGLELPYGGRINPAKLVSGMKKLVESMGVKIWEKTLVLKVTPGKTHRVETEMGEIAVPQLVLGVNGYAQKLGFFKYSMFPVGAYNIATAPLSETELDAIGWHSGRAMYDSRLEFDYVLMSRDNRIVIGGTEYLYYANDGLSSGNNKHVLAKLEKSLFKTFPQLKGIPVEHKWGGVVSYTMDADPAVGVMGDDANIYYAVGYSGHGVSFAHTAARIITDMMAGENNDFTNFFLVNRQIPFAGTRSTRYIGFKAYKKIVG